MLPSNNLYSIAEQQIKNVRDNEIILANLLKDFMEKIGDDQIPPDEAQFGLLAGWDRLKDSILEFCELVEDRIDELAAGDVHTIDPEDENLEMGVMDALTILNKAIKQQGWKKLVIYNEGGGAIRILPIVSRKGNGKSSK